MSGTSLLSTFCAGEVVINKETTAAIVELLNNKSGEVQSVINWNALAVGNQCKFEACSHNGKKYAQSSEHIVFYCNLLVGTTKHPVVVKFCMLRNWTGGVKVANMSANHAEPIKENYNTFKQHCAQWKKDPHSQKLGDVDVVGVAFVKVKLGWKTSWPPWPSSIDLWVERLLPRFGKFWGPAIGKNNEQKHLHMIATTNERLLKAFQRFVYEKSEKKYTVCDLQGQMISSKSFILCDIEFTHTLSKFKMDPDALLAEFKKSLIDGGDWLFNRLMMAGTLVLIMAVLGFQRLLHLLFWGVVFSLGAFGAFNSHTRSALIKWVTEIYEELK